MTFKFVNSPSKSNFPLLTEIDEPTTINSNSIEWNKNAFQTLLTSNLPSTTVFYYAINVGLRRLETSLYEAYWDVTADALNDLSQYLFTAPPVTNDVDGYLFEAKCQLLMYSAIAIIKRNTIRRQSASEAKMACATMCSLLFQLNPSYELPANTHAYSACHRAMHFRFLQREFIAGQWLSTLSQTQFNDIQSNHQHFISLLVDQLFPAVSLREKINTFIDTSLYSTGGVGNEDEAAIDFVFIRRFPRFNEQIFDQHSDQMHMGLIHTLQQSNKNLTRKLISCIWTLSCMIEADRISLETLNSCILHEHFSLTPIDFEQKPISLNERDLIVFLLLCAQQNTRFDQDDSILHPYLLFSSTHLCTSQQKSWWQSALEQPASMAECFVDHLATIRLVEPSTQHPPVVIILQTARILFKTARQLYEQHARRSASSYEQYALQYLQVAKTKKTQPIPVDATAKISKQDKFFFFFPGLKITGEDMKKLSEQWVDECERLARKCDELKLLPEPEPPRTSSPTEEQQQPQDFHLADTILSPVAAVENEQEPVYSGTIDSTLFATPPSNQSRDDNIRSSEPSLPIEEIAAEPAVPSLPPFVDLIFTHMNGVNQWINKFCATNAGIQNDIDAIRDRLEKLNRTTSQMIYSNVRMFQSAGSTYPPQ